MSNWRTHVINHFPPQGPKVTALADPDSLMRDESIATTLSEGGYEPLFFEDPVAFRHTYELHHRAPSLGDLKRLVVSVTGPEEHLLALPHDVWSAAYRVDELTR